MYSQPTQTDLNDSTRLANLQADRVSTNEEARALPWFCGHRPLAMNWLCDPFNVRTTDIQQKVGKDTQTTAHNYYVDIAAVVCHGPGAGVLKFTKQDEVVWEGEVMRGSSPYEDIDVPGHFRARIHWGLENVLSPNWLVLNKLSGLSTVELDPDLSPREYLNAETGEARSWEVANTTTNEHPAYVGQIVIEFQQLYCGNSSVGSAPPVPDVQVELLREPQVAGMNLDTSLTMGGCSAPAAMVELLTNERVGIDWTPAENLDVESWEELGRVLANNTAAYNISPYLSSDEKLRAVWGEKWSYFDGFIYTKEGKVAVGYFPHDGIVPSVVELTHDHILEKNQIRSGSLEDTINQVNARYDNVERGFKEDGLKAVSAYNRSVVGELRIEEYDPRFSILSTQVEKLIQEKVHTQSFPQASGTTVVPYADAFGLDGKKLRPGVSRFKLDDSDYSMDMIVRCTARQDDLLKGEVTLDWVQERGLFAMDYVNSQITVTPVLDPIVSVVNASVFEVPRAFSGTTRTTIALMVEKPAANTQGVRVHLSDFGTSYDLLKVQSDFALRGTLRESIPFVEIDPEIGTPEVTPHTFEINASGELIGVLQSQSNQSKINDELILCRDGEMFSIGRVIAMGNNIYQLETYRGRFKTEMAFHAAGSDVWILRRSSLEALAVNHNDFAEYSTKYFKLQTIVPGRLEPIEDSTVISYIFRQREEVPPLVVFEKFPTETETGITERIEGYIEDQNEDIAQWSMEVIGSSGDSRNVAGAPVGKKGYVPFSVPVSFDQAGSYVITVTASDFSEGEFNTGSASIVIVVTGESVAPEDNKNRIDEAEDLIDQAHQLIDELREEVQTFRTNILADVEEWKTKFAGDLDAIDSVVTSNFEAFQAAGSAWTENIEFAMSKALQNESAILSQETTFADLNTAIANIQTALTADMSILLGKVNAHADILTLYDSRISRNGADITATNTAIETMEATLKDDIRDVETGAAQSYASKTEVSNLNKSVVSINESVKDWVVWHGEYSGKISNMASAFIDSTGKVRLLYGWELDANGKFAKVTTIAQNDPRGQSFTKFMVEADDFEVKLADGQWYKLVTEHAVCQITGGGTYAGGDSTWKIRNVFSALFRKKSGGDTGATAEVKVYPDDGQ